MKPALKVDLACRGVWEAQMESLFDARVIDTNGPSYANFTSGKVIKNANKKKEKKYLMACEHRHASFTRYSSNHI